VVAFPAGAHSVRWSTGYSWNASINPRSLRHPHASVDRVGAFEFVRAESAVKADVLFPLPVLFRNVAIAQFTVPQQESMK